MQMWNQQNQPFVVPTEEDALQFIVRALRDKTVGISS